MNLKIATGTGSTSARSGGCDSRVCHELRRATGRGTVDARIQRCCSSLDPPTTRPVVSNRSTLATGCFAIPLISFFADPVSYVGRAVEERDTCYFPAPEEPNRLDVDQVHFLQVQHDFRFALRDLVLQFPQMLRPHSPNESNRRDGPIGISFDLQGHVRSIERSTSVSVAIPMPLVTC